LPLRHYALRRFLVYFFALFIYFRAAFKDARFFIAILRCDAARTCCRRDYYCLLMRRFGAVRRYYADVALSSSVSSFLHRSSPRRIFSDACRFHAAPRHGFITSSAIQCRFLHAATMHVRPFYAAADDISPPSAAIDTLFLEPFSAEYCLRRCAAAIALLVLFSTVAHCAVRFAMPLYNMPAAAS